MPNGDGVEASTRWGTLKLKDPVTFIIFGLFAIIFLFIAREFGLWSTPTQQLAVAITAQTKILEMHQTTTDATRRELMDVLKEQNRVSDYQNMILRGICYRLDPKLGVPCEQITPRKLKGDEQ